jgi:hypothetical protein
MTGAQIEYFECKEALQLPSTLKVGALYFVRDEKSLYVNHGHGNIVKYGVSDLGELTGTVPVEQGGTGVETLEDLLRLIGMPVTEQAIKDLQDQLQIIMGDINSLWQPYRQVPSYDFTTNVPTQAALTEYANRFVTPTEFANGVVVTNLFDGSDWFYDPRLQRWVSYGSSGLTIANLTTIGLVKASTGKGNIAVKQDGTMRVTDAETTLTRAAYDALESKNSNILYSVTEADGTFSFYLGSRNLKLEDETLEPLDDRIKKLEGTTIIKVTQELPRVIGATTQVPKESLPAEAIVQPKRLEIFDDNGTRATYLAEGEVGMYTFSTISTSSLPQLEPHLLGTVPTKADLPVNVEDFLAPRGLAPDVHVYDYIHVQRDETLGNQMVRYYVAAIDEDGVITWDYPLVVNTGEYQSKSTAAMGGKILTGSAAGGDFGTALTVANTVPETPNDTQVMTAGAIMKAIADADPDIDIATTAKAGVVLSSEADDKIAYNATGVGEVNGLSAWKTGVDGVLTTGVKEALAASQDPSTANPFQTRKAAQAPVDALAARVTALELGGGGDKELVATVSRPGAAIGASQQVTTSIVVPDKAFYAYANLDAYTTGNRAILRVNGQGLYYFKPSYPVQLVEVAPGDVLTLTGDDNTTLLPFKVQFFEATLLAPTGPIPLPEPTVSRRGNMITATPIPMTSGVAVAVPDKAFYAQIACTNVTSGELIVQTKTRYLNNTDLRAPLGAVGPTFIKFAEVAPGGTVTAVFATGTAEVNFFEADVYATGGVIPEPTPTVSRVGGPVGSTITGATATAPADAYYARITIPVAVADEYVVIFINEQTWFNQALLTDTDRLIIECTPGDVLRYSRSGGNNDVIQTDFFGATVKGLAASESVLKRLAALENNRIPRKGALLRPAFTIPAGPYAVPEGCYYLTLQPPGPGSIRININGSDAYGKDTSDTKTIDTIEVAPGDVITVTLNGVAQPCYAGEFGVVYK